MRGKGTGFQDVYFCGLGLLLACSTKSPMRSFFSFTKFSIGRSRGLLFTCFFDQCWPQPVGLEVKPAIVRINRCSSLEKLLCSSCAVDTHLAISTGLARTSTIVSVATSTKMMVIVAGSGRLVALPKSNL